MGSYLHSHCTVAWTQQDVKFHIPTYPARLWECRLVPKCPPNTRPWEQQGQLHTCVPTELWEIQNSCKSVPNQQGYVNADSCKSVHLTVAPGDSKDNSAPAYRPSYKKHRTRAKVFNQTLTPENSQSSVIQSSLKREIK